MKRNNLLLFIIFIFFIISCASSKSNLLLSTSALSGKTYQLANIFADSGITISFYDKEFYGYSGFNTYFGEYEVRRGNNIIFRNISMTKMSEESQSEESQSLEEIEKKYIDYITKSYRIILTEDGIRLLNSEAVELIFKRLR